MLSKYSYLLLSLFSGFLLAGNPADTFHRDFRQTPKLKFQPVHQNRSALSGEALAFDYLLENAETYRLPADLANLRLIRESQSLLGTHYHYGQNLVGVEVYQAEIIVSIDYDNHIYMVFNNTYPVDKQPTSPAYPLDEDDAYDVAWNDLQVRGELLNAPQIKLVYLPGKKGFRLTYLVSLWVEEPSGYWQSSVDAQTGEVFEVKETGLSRKVVANTRVKYDGPIDNRLRSFARAQALSASRQVHKRRVLADGTGLVFDPDPRTTLMDDNLQDTSPSSAFSAAYFTRDLLDIDNDGGTYRLNGPWVTIIDFEAPTTAPSTTTDGNWISERGPNSFNDAMTYYQIDKNQRYMQSLGFTGPTGIQDGPIGTDTDGFGGTDNSHYFPGSNRLGFGHGCVDDNEDVDVILHEYGHGINHDINPNFGGGDTGSIGEGFGDYWAGSYSYSTPNGQSYHPEWAFSWDGHGTGNPCWPGRLLTQTHFMYNPDVNYPAHATVGGILGDELWSAPLFASLTTMMGMGETREDVDQIILEAQFGLGGSLTMRDMANAIVAAAGALFPAGPHSDVFSEKFLAQNIIDLPRVTMLPAGVQLVSESGTNGMADPGETVGLTLSVSNNGNIQANDVVGVLSSPSPFVTILNGNANYPNLGVGQNGANNSDFTLMLGGGMACGDAAELTLDISWQDGTARAPGNTQLTFFLQTGVGLLGTSASSPGLIIDDNTSIFDILTIAATPVLVTGDFNVDINISHTFIGDLTVSLESPGGTTVVLHARTGGTAEDLIGNYPASLTPAESLSTFIGEPLQGIWTLHVADGAGGDTGTLNSWGLHYITEFECEQNNLCFGDLNGDGVVNATDYSLVLGNWANPQTGIDLNGDGQSNILDLLEILAAFGACP